MLPFALIAVLAGCGKASTKAVTAGATGLAASQEPDLAPERVYRVPSGSMEPTLTVGTYMLTEPIAPRVGDIVVFHPPKDAAQEVCGPSPHGPLRQAGAACDEAERESSTVKFIKRVVAGPGDVVSIVDGHVIRNGKREPDSLTRPCGASPECNFPTPIKIPAGDWFLLGDNRGESDDSCFWGPVPASWIVGVARRCSRVGFMCEPTK